VSLPSVGAASGGSDGFSHASHASGLIRTSLPAPRCAFHPAPTMMSASGCRSGPSERFRSSCGKHGRRCCGCITHFAENLGIRDGREQVDRAAERCGEAAADELQGRRAIAGDELSACVRLEFLPMSFRHLRPSLISRSLDDKGSAPRRDDRGGAED